ncbi:MAG: hypothetical protein D4R77_13285 [Planctomycetaceae bacterium]|nr:MAG: hypothetical protein D4R77_13285 [Planctomycetaceae bacterium]
MPTPGRTPTPGAPTPGVPTLGAPTPGAPTPGAPRPPTPGPAAPARPGPPAPRPPAPGLALAWETSHTAERMTAETINIHENRFLNIELSACGACKKTQKNIFLKQIARISLLNASIKRVHPSAKK